MNFLNNTTPNELYVNDYTKNNSLNFLRLSNSNSSQLINYIKFSIYFSAFLAIIKELTLSKRNLPQILTNNKA
jgi:hypothetical protein|tara:strand:+ start:1825 stop:2043 length:219 start_codon:yes stop_codon:yes gene_type:complete